jgi:broad specificity phosphatase PhoE
VRINNELYNLDRQAKASGENKEDSGQEHPRKKRKIIIHSSPYLRCVQTSIAIAAGIQHPQNHNRPQPQRLRSRQLSSLSPTDEAPEHDPDAKDVDRSFLERFASKGKEHTNRIGYDTCILRIDAFLGEWQSANYFGEASYPPPSAILVSQAKMALKKPQEEIKGADLSTSNFNVPDIEAMEEKENEPTSVPAHEKTGLRAMAAAGHSFSKRPRNISFGTELANGARILNRALQRPIGYSPPVPTYAIGSSDNIPSGFAAHARDACIEFDADWNSQGEPLDWGDGGPNDEEWGKMHRRFRNGLQKLIAYYENQADSANGDDEDLVVILVSHQAGCNALIRLLTGAPALIDVGLSSLSMAVRNDNEHSAPEPSSPTRRRGSIDLSISEYYDMRIIASTEHLRAGSNPLGLNSPRLGKSPAFASRRAVGADSPDGFTLGEPMAPRGSGSMMPARSSSQMSCAADVIGSSEPPTGLWRRGSRYSRDETADSSEAGATPSTWSGTRSDSIQEEFPSVEVNGAQVEPDTSGSDQRSDSHLLPVRSASQRGLWGGESSIRRDRSPGKRRWTAIDRSP